MKEIKVLIRQLKKYPENFFIYPQEQADEHEIDNPPRLGLVVCSVDGQEQGFIETGSSDGVVIQ